MDFGIIKCDAREIEMEEWRAIVSQSAYLLPMEPKTGINPFTGKETLFHRDHSAYYVEDEKPAGNISLEQGVLLTTGVPASVCSELAVKVGGSFLIDDRS